MKKLIGLKDWLTLDEAAVYLTSVAEEAVTEADLIRLGLDNHLQLSLFLDDWLMVRTVEFETKVEDGVKVICLGEAAAEPTRVEGVWDLAAYGVAVNELERLYRSAKGLPLKEKKLSLRTGLYLHDEGKTMVFEVLRMRLNVSFRSREESTAEIEHDSPSTGGGRTLVELSKDDQDLVEEVNKLVMNGIHELGPVIKERIHSFYPALELPEQAILVVRRDELQAFAAKHLGGSLKAELTPTERANSYQIMAVMAAMAGLDISKPYKAVGVLRKEAAARGLELPASDETIVKFLGGPARKKR
nr:hypothetical protein [uncultured Pseudomonas sp.]